MKTTLFVFALMLTSVAMMSCESNEPLASTAEDQIVEEATRASVIVESTLSEVCVTPAVTDSLSDADVAGLLLMREEEKLAADVYSYFYSLFKYPVFNNISKSETVHAKAVLYLLNSFKIADPHTGVAGVFTNSDMQSQYTDLTTSGSVNITEALKAGALIEENDIKDLKQEIASTDNASIIRVYSNLLRGSGFHLKSFVRLLKLKGVVYAPQVLTPEEFAEITQ